MRAAALARNRAVPTDVPRLPRAHNYSRTVAFCSAQVDERYDVQKYLGSGSYGVVVSAHTPDGTPVAIKKIGALRTPHCAKLEHEWIVHCRARDSLA